MPDRQTDIPPGTYAETRGEAERRQAIWAPVRRVLVLQASARLQRGATETVLRATVGGMEEAGAEVQVVYLAQREIGFCLGCFHCWGDPAGRCALDDDMGGLLEQIVQSDLLLLATPLYVDGMPGRLKNFFDRTLPLVHPAVYLADGRGRHPSRHERMPFLALLSVCGYYDLENFTPLVTHVQAIADNMHAPLVASLLRPTGLLLGSRAVAPAATAVLSALHTAGRELVATGGVSAGVLAAVSAPLVTREEFLSRANGWRAG